MASKTDYEQAPMHTGPLVTGADEEVHIAMTNQIELQEYDKEENKYNKPKKDNKKNKKNKTKDDTDKTQEQYKEGPEFDKDLWDEIKDQRLDGSPSNWSWEQVQKWLYKNNLWIMWDVFNESTAIDKDGTDGDALLDLNKEKLTDDSGDYKAIDQLEDILIPELFPGIEEKKLEDEQKKLLNEEIMKIVDIFLHELTKLRLIDMQYEIPDSKKQATVDDLIEMKRRIHLFIEKWDRILWIADYVEKYNGILPTPEIVSEELGVSNAIAEVYLDYHKNMDELKDFDISEILFDFNVYNDCVIWWFVIVNILTTQQTKSLWLLFNKVAELTPGNVAIELLDDYKDDLTRFEAERLEEMAQNIVIGSAYPICCALKMSAWFKEIADFDVARGEVFELVSDSFIDVAFDYLKLIESDHMAAIMLEAKSDIEEMSAMDMALDYKLQKFVSTNRIERITTSVMNDFEFLQPENISEAFEIDPLSIGLVFRKLFYPQFYFTPLGTWVTEVSLYFGYLGLFTYLSVSQFRVYNDLTPEEIIFWIFNIGYVASEFQMFFTYGPKQYYSESQNYFDTLISVVFISSIALRIYALITGAPCEGNINGTDIACWTNDNLNTTFVVLWGIATVTLWLRIINFCILSHNLGPMVQMIFNMMGDIATFFTIMAILFVAFTMCLVFIMGDVYEGFANPLTAGITLFRALLGDFDFAGFDETEGSLGLRYFGIFLMLLYLLIGSLVLLNLLVAVMAKTFDTIEETTRQSIIFAKFKLAMDKDRTASFMPPPYNIIAMAFFIIFLIVEKLINFIKRVCCCCCMKGDEFIPFDLAVFLMPAFMKQRQLELDQQILFKQCGKQWKIITNKGLTWCKFKKYEADIMHHVVEFEKIVSVRNSVERKTEWKLDMFDLYREGLISLKQFDINVDHKYTHKAHKSMNKEAMEHWKNILCCKDIDQEDEFESPYWICGYCRGYVKASKTSVKKLGFLLGVNPMEMKIINKVSPEICPNCYRVRLERPRWELIWEIISYWIFKLLIWWLLVGISGILLFFTLLSDPDELEQTYHELRKQLKKQKIEIEEETAVDKVQPKPRNEKWETTEDLLVMYNGGVNRVKKSKDDEQEDTKEDTNENAKNKNNNPEENKSTNWCCCCREEKKEHDEHVSFHYTDTQLISNLNEMSMETDIQMFDDEVPDEIWTLLKVAKNNIEGYLLKDKINKYILNFCAEDELSQFEYYDDFINKDGIIEHPDQKKNTADIKGRKAIWNNYFKPLAQTLFTEIKKLRKDYIPLHLFLRYPLDMTLVTDDFQGYLDMKAEQSEQDEAQALNKLGVEDIVKALENLKFLNCREGKEDIKEDTNEDDIFNLDQNKIEANEMKNAKNAERYEIISYIKEKNDNIWCYDDNEKPVIALFDKFSRYVTEIHSLFNDTRKIKNMLRDVGNAMIERGVEEKVLDDQIPFLFEDVRNSALALPFFNSMRTDGDKIELWTIRNTLQSLYFLKHTINKHLLSEHSRIYVTKNDLLVKLLTLHKGTVLQAEEMLDMINNNKEWKIDEYINTVAKVGEAEKQERLELFHKSQITAEDVAEEISKIFDNIQTRRKNKITETTIDYYRRKGLKTVGLLQDDEALRYMYEALSRYATFNLNKMTDICDYKTLYNVLTTNKQFIKYGEDYKIDKETIPEKIDEKTVQELYVYLIDLYNKTIEKSNSLYFKDKKTDEMTMKDVLTMILLFQRTFDTLNTKIVDSGDDYVVEHDIFCSFVDDQFDIDAPRKQWSQLTKAASDLFQNVLDEQQAFVTLGQARQTVDKLMDDIAGMECGELTRIRNYLQNYKEKIDEEENKDYVEEDFTKNKEDLQFVHVDKDDWKLFLEIIAKNFANNVCGTTLSGTQNNEIKFNDNGILCLLMEETDFDIIDNKFNEKDYKKKGQSKADIDEAREEVFDSILSFCGQRLTLQQLLKFAKQFATFLKNYAHGNLKNIMKNYKEMTVKYNDVNKIHEDITEIAKTLSLNKRDLDKEKNKSKQKGLEAIQTKKKTEEKENNDAIQTLLDERQKIKKKLKDTKLQSIPVEGGRPIKIKNKKDFVKQYFDIEEDSKVSNDFRAELAWLYLECENEYDLCHKIYPFWSSSLRKDIITFMDSSKEIKGNYQLKAGEFSQLKHTLQVNDELALKLFRIIRFKIRTLTWEQIFDYFDFLLRMKYSAQSAILVAKQAENTTVSMGGMKLALKIASNDENTWFFNVVDSIHGAKVTWKQIRKYLSKMMLVRDEMRDFFTDNKRDREFEENQSEIVNTIHENSENTQETIKSMKSQFDKFEEKLDKIVEHLRI